MCLTAPRHRLVFLFFLLLHLGRHHTRTERSPGRRVRAQLLGLVAPPGSRYPLAAVVLTMFVCAVPTSHPHPHPHSYRRACYNLGNVHHAVGKGHMSQRKVDPTAKPRGYARTRTPCPACGVSTSLFGDVPQSPYEPLTLAPTLTLTIPGSSASAKPLATTKRPCRSRPS